MIKEKKFMKKGLKAVGKAVAYFAVYLLSQVLVSVVYSTVLSTQMTMELMAAGEELDVMAMTEALTAEVMSRAMEMTFIAGVVALLIFWLVFLIRKKKFTKEKIKNFIDILNKPDVRVLPGTIAFFLFMSIVPIIMLGTFITL